MNKPSPSRSLALGLALATAAGGALAHPGHGSASALAGLAHPLGLDHLLAMVAVGLWSAAVLPASQRLRGPAAFVLAMLAGAALGTWTRAPALVEPGIAASVAVLGLLIALPRLLPGTAGLALVAVAGALHGLAHGAELPASTGWGNGFAAYAFGFVATTVLLHAAGLGLGRQLLVLPQRLARASQAALGGGLGLVGLALASRV
ncbi:MAG: HupE/UreJ family protein [Burkholderiaceae bacterium]|nr:HupE/UreJ family protein [Burkholderiaceae bacterium]